MMICKICQNAKNNQVYEAREMMFGLKDKFTYFQCGNCECLQISEIPQDMSKYYPENYYSFNDELPIPRQRNNFLIEFVRKYRNDYAVFKKGLIGKAIHTVYPNKKLDRLVENYFPFNGPEDTFNKSSRILEVGCGNGELLFALKEVGFENVLGIDPFIKETIKYPNGLSILKTTIHAVNGEYDFIVFHHSFEHVADPLETIRSVTRLLAKDGICLIRIPTVSSYAWECYRENWVQLDCPRHFFLHSIRSMEILSNKAKLKLIKIIYDSGDFQFWASEQYLQDIPLTSQKSYSTNRSESIFSENDIQNFRRKADILNKDNKGDQAAFYFQKL